jgi:uncharacterized membrane protein (UPF0136 family)
LGFNEGCATEFIQHRQRVASAFHAISLALGIPSFLAFVLLALESLRAHFTNPVAADSGASGNQLIDLFVGGFRLAGKVLGFFGDVAEWIVLILAVVSFICVVLAVVLFFTARGIRAGRTWTRILGIVLAIHLFIVSLTAILSLRQPVPFVLSTAIATTSVYVIWALGFRFNQ